MAAAAQLLPDEQTRLDALARYDVLDTPAEDAFDRLTRLTGTLFDVPMSTITFVDGHRQWFKSRQGLDACESARGPAFCDRAMREAGGLVVEDTAADARFRDNPFVTGKPHIRFYAGTPLCTPEGQPIGTLCAMDTRPRRFGPVETAALADLGRLVMEVMELRVQATTDALTGLMSRRAFREEAERAVALACRHRHDLACLMVDLDRFKAVNDHHGHATGDAVLRATALACRAVLRTSDLIGRVGGEEFAVLLPMTARSGAMEVAERLRAGIARLRIDGPAGEVVAVSASIGVAILDASAQGLDALMARADAALYRAKDEGRDRSVAWEAAVALEPDRRRRVLKAGRISFNSGRSTIDCTVRALSGSEAGISVVTSAGIPETFKLQIESERISKACRIVAKREQFIDVAFA